MEYFKLENVDPEDIGDLLSEVEKSFNIKFEENELIGIKTFGELSDHITNKIQLENSNDCTSQQAFYKLRTAISTELGISKEEITRQQKLKELLPKNVRKSHLKKLEQNLGFKLNILSSPFWVIIPLLAIVILSFICFFFTWKLAVSGIAFSFLGFWIADLTANEIDLENVGQLAEKMTRENYSKSRRNPQTVNKIEMEKILTDWFSDKLGLEKDELTKDTKFV